MKTATVFAILLAACVCFAQNAPRGGARGNANSIVGLLMRADVREELKLTADQVAALEAANPRGQGRRGQGQGQPGGAVEVGDAEAMRRARMEREAATMKVLSEPQQKRLQELFVQRVGARSAMYEPVAKALGITQEQTAQMRQLQQRQREANQAVMERVRNGEIDRAQVREIQAKNEEALGTEMMKILTPEQQAKLRLMGGAPFTFRDER